MVLNLGAHVENVVNVSAARQLYSTMRDLMQELNLTHVLAVINPSAPADISSVIRYR